MCRRHNINEDQLLKWKQQFVENVASLFESRDKPSKETAERIAHLEQLVGRLEDSRCLISSGLDGTVRLWDPETGRLQATLTGYTGVPEGLALSKDQDLLITAGYDGTLLLWDLRSIMSQGV